MGICCKLQCLCLLNERRKENWLTPERLNFETIVLKNRNSDEEENTNVNVTPSRHYVGMGNYLCWHGEFTLHVCKHACKHTWMCVCVCVLMYMWKAKYIFTQSVLTRCPSLNGFLEYNLACQSSLKVPCWLSHPIVSILKYRHSKTKDSQFHDLGIQQVIVTMWKRIR